MENKTIGEEIPQQYKLIVVILISVVVFLFMHLRQRLNVSKLSEQSLIIKNQEEKLQKLELMKSKFFAKAGQALNTPVTLMLEPIEHLIKDNSLNPIQTELVKAIEDSSKQIKLAVNDILDLAEFELGKKELIPADVNLHSFLYYYFEKFNESAKLKKLDYQIDINIDEGLLAKIDEHKTQKLINNILSNSIRFTPSGGFISVEAIVCNHQIEINISDSGLGIAKEDIPYLFDKYFQVEKEKQSAQEGFGVGLTLCKEIIDLFGGTIEVESDLGIGSSFKLSWPIDCFFDNEQVIEGIDLIPVSQGEDLMTSNEKLLAIETSEIEDKNSTNSDERDKDWIKHLEIFIDNNLSNNLMNVTYIAESLAISESSLLRKTKRIVGLTPQAFIKERRLQAAKIIFEKDKSKTIKEVALMVGYMDSRTLSRNFKSRFGRLPSAITSDYIIEEN